MIEFTSKSALRSRMRALRDALPQRYREDHALEICHHIAGLPEFGAAQVIALYMPMGSEVDVLPLVGLAADAQRFVMPVALAGRRMEFVVVERLALTRGGDDLPGFLAHPGRIREGVPSGFEVVGAVDIDLMVVPGLAFDRVGYRLGYGGGYYDAYLARPGFRALTCGVCFDGQVVDALPHEVHDQPLDLVLAGEA